ncbi:MAG: four helix bundle protein [Nostoc sp.]|uniref:four helix bundle protein n=1 Tax=Nostoc sp. TaxID=1180 RepID=UPI002FF8F8CF
MKSSSIQFYQDLKVWQESMNLAEICYQVTKTFPQEETYGMISHIRRAAVSIPANIAEDYGRRTRGEYIQFLYISQGSLKELETHLLLSIRVKLDSPEMINNALNQCESVSKLLFFLIRSLQNQTQER